MRRRTIEKTITELSKGGKCQLDGVIMANTLTLDQKVVYFEGSGHCKLGGNHSTLG